MLGIHINQPDFHFFPRFPFFLNGFFLRTLSRTGLDGIQSILGLPIPFHLRYCPEDWVELLGHDGVSEALKSVHPSGNPISHSTHVGFSKPPTAVFNSVFWLNRFEFLFISCDL